MLTLARQCAGESTWEITTVYIHTVYAHRKGQLEQDIHRPYRLSFVRYKSAASALQHLAIFSFSHSIHFPPRCCDDTRFPTRAMAV